ncbi:MAG: ribonucleotide-diphosphate reductase subunit beta [Mycoplasmatales bacterium]
MEYLHYKAINWNVIEDELDNSMWERATSLFWLDTRIPIKNDLPEWKELTTKQQKVFNKVVTAMATLSTFQSRNGYEVIRTGKRTQQEIAIYNNIQFIESVHTKAFNSMLMAFNTYEEVEELLKQADTNLLLQERLQRIEEVYLTGTPLQKKIANLLVEGVLPYSGMLMFLNFWGQKRFLNIAEMIKLILMNESLHCQYIVHKLNLQTKDLTKVQMKELNEWANKFVTDLMELEVKIIKDIYNEESLEQDAFNLVTEQINQIFEELEFTPLYETQSEYTVNIDVIRDLLANVTKHSIVPQKGQVYKQEDEMTEYDYDF